MTMGLYPMSITRPYTYLLNFFVSTKKPIPMCGYNFVLITMLMQVADTHELLVSEKIIEQKNM